MLRLITLGLVVGDISSAFPSTWAFLICTMGSQGALGALPMTRPKIVG